MLGNSNVRSTNSTAVRASDGRERTCRRCSLHRAEISKWCAPTVLNCGFRAFVDGLTFVLRLSNVNCRTKRLVTDVLKRDRKALSLSSTHWSPERARALACLGAVQQSARWRGESTSRPCGGSAQAASLRRRRCCCHLLNTSCEGLNTSALHVYAELLAGDHL
jgi:hypothetical protein